MAFEVVLTLVGAAVLVGAAIQGSFGFGYALVLVPTLALLYPEAIPVTPLLLLLVMTSYMTIREWGSIDVGAFFSTPAGAYWERGLGLGCFSSSLQSRFRLC